MVSCDWTLARSSLKPSRVSTGSYCGSVPLWGGPNDQVGRLKDAAGPDGFKVCLFCHKQDVFQQLRWNNLNMYHHLEELPGRCVVFMCRRSRNEMRPEDLGQFWFFRSAVLQPACGLDVSDSSGPPECRRSLRYVGRIWVATILLSGNWSSFCKVFQTSSTAPVQRKTLRNI